jgi:hypothetical protein
MSVARTLTKWLGGEWHGHYGLIAGPGHSARDRSLKISDHDSDPEDVIVHSFAGDDVLSIKADWRARGLLPRRRETDGAVDYGVIAKRKAERQQRETEEKLKRQGTTCDLWKKSQPAERTVQAYLSSRGINIAAPATVRFLPSSVKYPYPAIA